MDLCLTTHWMKNILTSSKHHSFLLISSDHLNYNIDFQPKNPGVHPKQLKKVEQIF
jgi:hypothetical protein